MSRLSLLSGKKALNKKALVLAVSSVLTGWVGGVSSYALAESPDGWPPKAAKKIAVDGAESLSKTQTVTIKSKCDGSTSTDACNIQLGAGSTLKNAGTINVEGSSIIVEGSDSKAAKIESSGKIDVKSGTGVLLKKGHLTVNTDDSGVITVAKGAKGVHIEKGQLTVSGKGSFVAKDSAISIAKNDTKLTAGADPTPEASIIIDDSSVDGDIVGSTGDGNKKDLVMLQKNAIINGDIKNPGSVAIEGVLKEEGKVKTAYNWKVNGTIIAPIAIGVGGEVNDLHVMGKQEPVKMPTASKAKALRVITRTDSSTTTIGAHLINKLHVEGSARLQFKSADKGKHADVSNVTIDSKAAKWVVEGWATNTEKVEVHGAGVSLIVNDKQPTTTTATAKKQTLHIANKTNSKGMVEPTRIMTSTPELKLSALTIQGAAHVHFGQDLSKVSTAIEKVHVASTPSPKWKTEGWINSASLMAKSEVRDLFVSDSAKTPVDNKKYEQGALRLASKAPIAIQTTGAGAGQINNLHIIDSASIRFNSSKESPVVKNVMIDAKAGKWSVNGLAKGVKTLQTASEVSELHVFNPAPTSKQAATVKPKSLQLVATDLMVDTQGAGKVSNLHINSAAELKLGSTASNAAMVHNVMVNKGAKGWKTAGWFKDTEIFQAASEVSALHVSDKADNKRKLETQTLRIAATKPITIATPSGGKVKELNIHNAPDLVFGNQLDIQSATIAKVVIKKSEKYWKTNGWLDGVESLTADGDITHLYVSDKASKAIAPGTMAKTLRMVTPKVERTAKAGASPVRVTSEGKINHLHIYGAASLASSEPITNVENIEVNSNENWLFAGNLNGVKSVKANGAMMKIVKPATKGSTDNSSIIKAVSLAEAVSSGRESKTLTISTKTSSPVITASEPGLIKIVNIGDKATFGTVTNASDINIIGSGWKSTGLVVNPKVITVGAIGAKKTQVAAINSVGSTKTAPTQPASLNVAFDGKADLRGFVEIKTIGSGTIDQIDFSDGTNRPNLRFTPSADIDYKKNKGSSKKYDTIVLSGDAKQPDQLPQGFKGIAYNGVPKNIMPDLKRLELDSIADKNVITTSKDMSGSFIINIPFTDKMPDAFHLTTASKNKYSFAFSDPNRPSTTFEIASGTVTKLLGNPSKHDKLMLSGGALESAVNSIDTLIISGKEWQATGTFSKLKNLIVYKTGIVKSLTVTGMTTPKSATVGKNTLVVQTDSKRPLPVSVDGSLDSLNITQNAALGDVKLNGGTIDIANVEGNASWRLGHVIDAGAVNAPTHNFDRVMVGKGLNAAIPDNKHLVLDTQTKHVSLTANSIKRLDIGNGAMLNKTTAAVHHVAISAMGGWSVTEAIPMATNDKGVATIDIAKDVKVAGLGGKGSAWQVSFKSPKKEANKTLVINNAGMITGGINLANTGAPSTVKLMQSAGAIKGDINGVSYAEFSGDSHFMGDFKSPVKSVQVKGKLTAMGGKPLELRHADPSGPTLMIAKGGDLVTDRAINVVGTYSQDGDLHYQGDLSVTGAKPVVNASSINIGTNARLFIKSKDAIKDTLLMQSDTIINRPVMLMTVNKQYEHFIATLSNDKKKMVVNMKPIGPYIKNLAMTGGAPESASKALEVAAGPKGTPLPKAQLVNDPLNALVIKHATTPASAALLAEQLTPDNTASTVTAAQGAQNQVGKAIANRTSNKLGGVNSGDMMGAGSFWVQYAYSDATQDERHGVFGYSAKTNGFTLGVDSDLNDMTDIGVAYTYAKGDISGKGGGSGSSIDSKNHVFTLYSSFKQGSMFADGRLSYARGSNDARRAVLNHQVKASYDSKNWGVGLNGGYNLPLNNEWTVQPLGAFNYYRISLDDYAEKAAIPAFNYLTYDKVNNEDYSIAELGFGLKVLGDLQSSGKVSYKPQATVMAFHDFKKDPVSMRAHYAIGGNSFVVNGAKRDQNRYLAVVSMDVSPMNNMVFSASASYDWTKSYKAKGILLRARYDF